jgi:hypothetical protein
LRFCLREKQKKSSRRFFDFSESKLVKKERAPIRSDRRSRCQLLRINQAQPGGTLGAFETFANDGLLP